MSLSLHIDPYLLVCPTIGHTKEEYLSFINNLLDWDLALKKSELDIVLHPDVPTSLFEINSYPLFDSLKYNHRLFNIDYLSVDSINKIVTSFFNKVGIDYFFEIDQIKVDPIHRQYNRITSLDNILNQIYTYILASNETQENSFLISTEFPRNKVNSQSSIRNGCCQYFDNYPKLLSGEITVFNNYDSFGFEEDLELLETTIKPLNKKIKLSGDHHGNKLLKKFAKKLLKSPYIIEVINNLEFKYFETDIIHKIYEDGKIELVLVDTDEGFGIIIQTTGRNLEETKKIAEKIRSDFG